MYEEELGRASGVNNTVPQEATSYYNFMRGELAINNENFDEALHYFELAAAAPGKDPAVLYSRLAQLYVRSGDLTKSLAYIDKALAIKVNDLELLQLRAGVLATLRKIPESIQTYEQILALEPENEDTYILLASLYAQEGDLPAAKKTLERLVAKNPSSTFAYHYLARMSELSQNLPEAEKYYKKALEISPGSDGIQLDYARVMGIQKRFAEAIAICDEVLKNEPANLSARKLRGQLLLGDNKIDQALSEFEELGKLEEDPTETRFKIALIKLERRDFVGSVTEFNLVLAKDPENAGAHYYLATAYAALKRPADALAELAKVPAEHKMFAQAKAFSAFLLQEEKRYDEAIVQIKEALKVKENDPQLLAFLAGLQREAGQISDGIKTLEELIKVEPSNDKHLFTLGVFYDDIKDNDKAVESMRKAIALNPKNGNALNYLGYSMAENGGNLIEAQALVTRALAEDPDNGYFIDSLGWIYFKMGRFSESLTELRKAVKAVPDDPLILEHLGRVELQQGLNKEALKTLKKAQQSISAADDKDLAPRLNSLIQELEAQLGSNGVNESRK